MTTVVDAVFGGLFGKPDKAPPQVAAPAKQETQAQKTQEDIVKAQEAKAVTEAEGRAKIVTARSAGPQTLFKRADAIPTASKLGGGRRA